MDLCALCRDVDDNIPPILVGDKSVDDDVQPSVLVSDTSDAAAHPSVLDNDDSQYSVDDNNRNILGFFQSSVDDATYPTADENVPRQMSNAQSSQKK